MVWIVTQYNDICTNGEPPYTKPGGQGGKSQTDSPQLSWTIWNCNGLGNWSDTETLVQYFIDICHKYSEYYYKYCFRLDMWYWWF